MPILSKEATKKLLESGDLVIQPAPKEEHYDSDLILFNLPYKSQNTPPSPTA